MNPLKLTFLSVAVVLCLTACEDPGKYLDPEENKSVDLGNGWTLINSGWRAIPTGAETRVKNLTHVYKYEHDNYTFAYECGIDRFIFSVNLPYRDRSATGDIWGDPTALMSKKDSYLTLHNGILLSVHTPEAGDEELSTSNPLIVASMEDRIRDGINLKASINEEIFLREELNRNLNRLTDALGKVDKNHYVYYVNYLIGKEWKELWEEAKEQDEELKKLKLYLDKLDSYEEKLKKRPCNSFWCASGDDALSDKEQFELATQILTETEQWSIDVDNAGMYYSIDINKEPFYGLGLMESLVEELRKNIEKKYVRLEFEKEEEFKKDEVEKIRQELIAEFSQRIPANIKIPPIPKVKKFTNGSLCDFKEYKKKEK